VERAGTGRVRRCTSYRPRKARVPFTLPPSRERKPRASARRGAELTPAGCCSRFVWSGGPWDWSRDLREQDDGTSTRGSWIPSATTVSWSSVIRSRTDVTCRTRSAPVRKKPCVSSAGGRQLGAEWNAQGEDHRGLDDPPPRRPAYVAPAHRRMQGRSGRVGERPAAYAESPRPLRHEGPAGHVRSLIPGVRNVAKAQLRRAADRR
jgi:hypothetical protein